MAEFDYEELEAAADNFSPSRIIGKGSHGCIFKGILRDGKIVAIKKQSPGLQNLQEHDSNHLENEIQVLRSLNPNPYLITLLGTSHEYASNNRVLVMEHMPNGTLHDLLHVSPTPPPWPKRVQVAIQVAKAVRLIHQANPVVIHRDIKSANILFDSNWDAKLADFGIAIRQGGQQVDLSRPAGTFGYLDPCYTSPCELSTKIDLFSFGVVLLEIISSMKVIDVSRVPSSIVEWALPLIEEDRFFEIYDRRVVLPDCVEGMIRHMLRIASRCVSNRQDYRPSMGEIVEEMENCFVERVRFPVSIYTLARFLKRRRRMIAKRKTSTTTVVVAAATTAVTKGKILLLREVLADMTLE